MSTEGPQNTPEELKKAIETMKSIVRPEIKPRHAAMPVIKKSKKLSWAAKEALKNAEANRNAREAKRKREQRKSRRANR